MTSLDKNYPLILCILIQITDSFSVQSNSIKSTKCADDIFVVKCQLPNPSSANTINHIKLARNMSAFYEEIITLRHFDDSVNQTLRVERHSYAFLNRTSINASVIFPANESKLILQIRPDEIQCSDSGTYICEIHYTKSGSFQGSIDTTQIYKDYNCVCDIHNNNGGITDVNCYVLCMCVLFLFFGHIS